MKLKLLILPLIIGFISACGDDDKKQTAPKLKSSTPPNAQISNGDLLQPDATGNVTAFQGATRLKAERTEALRASLSNRKVKNVILFIGDGTSDSEITAARNYAEGASGYFKGLDVLPFTGAYTTYSVDEKTKTINYVTDSAASATAWASGVKTYNNALGIDLNGNVQKSLLMLAKTAGFATGNVTTTTVYDATPAAMISHISHRSCYGPVDTQRKCPKNSLDNPNGNGLGSITEQLLNTRADVTFGGGAQIFSERVLGGKYQGKTLLDQAKEQKYQIVSDLNQMQAITEANQEKPLLGLFANHHLPVSWAGPMASINGNKQPAQKCNTSNPHRPASIPTLKQMTSKAIDLLKANKQGFFLQVESGSIDRQNHLAIPCGQIGETVALDQAMQVALEFAKHNPDTLIIVTGDHAHTSQIIPNNANSPGQTLSLITKDNAVMTLNYATAHPLSTQEHTGAQVRIAAYGPRAANISGLLDQTDLFFIMRDALGIK